ncbi:MAG: bifunctional folylpolyglutamate synthase/dihydrofolate synthase, partial [Bacteroidota bacterium]|nr:bifunctional folylpolyglutamate synthase/dihydrofolate synthase [Bacteroidota bacterium]
IITPELSIITNIGWDHMNMLGDSLEKIAFEKAGIIKQNIPVVIGESIAETKPVFEQKAKELSAPIIFAQEKKYVADWKYEDHFLNVAVAHHHNDERENYSLDLPGIYQTKNLLTVLESVHQLNLKGWQLHQPVIQKALSEVKKLTGLHGRWEVIKQHPTIVLDVAHNVDGMKQVAEQIKHSDYDHLHIVIGMVKDKEVEKVLELLPHHATYYFSKAQIPRALNEESLMQKAKVFGLKGDAYATVDIALRSALTNAGKKDMILVCGSVFVVGEVNL